MNMARASGRNLFPDSFGREVFSCVNLPPLYLLMEKFIPEMFLEEMKKNKGYIRRGQGMLRRTRKFKYAELSSSIGNFRSKDHEKFTMYTDIVTLILDSIDCFGFI